METLNLSRQPVGGELVVVPDANGLWQTWERPRRLCRYMLSARPGGLFKVVGGSKQAERSTCMVLRAGYVEEDGKRILPRLVCRLAPPLNLDATPMAELIAMTAQWFGQAICFIEVKDGATLAKEAQRLGADVQIRQVLDRVTSEWTREIGWCTDEENGPAALNALINAVRDTGTNGPAAIEIECPHALAELEKFQVDPSKVVISHDDDVRTLATAVFNLESASLYPAEYRKRVAPADGWRPVETFG